MDPIVAEVDRALREIMRGIQLDILNEHQQRMAIKFSPKKPVKSPSPKPSKPKKKK